MIRIKHMPRWMQRFAKDDRGVSAVEFAILLPLMLTIYLGGVEVSQGVAADRKVTLTARTVADLVSQVTSINVTGTNAVLEASSAVLAPYPVSKATVTVSLIKIDANKNMTIDWSETKNGTKRTTVPAGTLPDSLVVANTWLVWGEATYAYTPVMGYVMTGTFNLKDQIFMRPRLSNDIKHPAG